MMAQRFEFQVEARGGRARAGHMNTGHGRVTTPAFMPVATQATVKGLSAREVKELGADILLSNTYHLYLRPGIAVIEEMGGLHRFMSWDGPILTDSGGFQAFSLGRLVRFDDNGMEFRSHVDGSRHLFTPEKVVEYQRRLGVDVMMCLDQCVAANGPEETVRQAMERTHRWAARCRQAALDGGPPLFGIVQGGISEEMRRESAQFITSLEFPGYAVGGLAVGETKSQMYATVDLMDRSLPEARPRYLMGVGSPEDLVECVARGVDLFDCALPTRVARTGAVFTPAGRITLSASRFSGVKGPVDPACDCPTCQDYDVGYLNHLFKTRELLGLRLATLHNLRFIHRLMARMRAHILEGTFQTFAQGFLSNYKPTDETARMKQKEKWLESRLRG